MNYLAHAYLSFGNPGILVGNMVSDFIKGKAQYDYPDEIQKGIKLHRMIDRFTDDHPETAKAKVFFRPYYRLYSGAFVDIVYDHFLANDKALFTESSLALFSESVYGDLFIYQELLPPGFRGMLPYMRDQDWLFNYRTTWGIRNSFGGLVRRAAYMNNSEEAFRIFTRHYKELESCYNEFMPALLSYTRHQFDLMRTL